MLNRYVFLSGSWLELKDRRKTQTGWGGREQNCHWKRYSVLCVRGIWREIGPCRIYQGIFHFLFFFFEDVIHSSTERLIPHKVGHPGAIHGQGINFFPRVRRSLASCVDAKCLSLKSFLKEWLAAVSHDAAHHGRHLFHLRSCQWAAVPINFMHH